jgi:hypothetical protein
MNPTSNAAGKFRSKPKLAIIRVEHLDADGESFTPPEYEFWVVVPGTPPVVKAVTQTYEEACKELERLENEPQP